MESAYKGKRVLITGNTGFKGSWLSIWLLSMGAKVHGISDRVPTEPSHFALTGLEGRVDHRFMDIRDFQAVKKAVNEIRPDFVFHLAAQALVKASYEDPYETFSVNAMGTANLLNVLRSVDFPCTAVMVTSDKCYENVEWPWGYRETDAMGGKDPYSGSKSAAEMVIKSFFHSYFDKPGALVKIGIGRAGNVIGGGDWSADRIVADCVKAWSQKKSVDIRSPRSTRPWEHVLEPLSGYLQLAAALAGGKVKSGEAFNFGPNDQTDYSVERLINGMAEFWPDVKWRDVSEKNTFHEAKLLKLSCDKALYSMNWRPVLDFDETVRFTAEWYRDFYKQSQNGGPVYDYTVRQIKDFVALAKERNIEWSKG